MDFLLIPLLSVLGRMAGGGMGASRLPSWGGGVPELAFGLVFAIAVAAGGLPLLLAPLSFALAWRGLEFGHDTGYHMGYRPDLTANGDDFLKPLVSRISSAFKFPSGGKAYCWVHMGLKGACIGAATMSPFGLLLALFFPASYELAWALQKRFNLLDHEQRGAAAEFLSGAASGAVLWMSV